MPASGDGNRRQVAPAGQRAEAIAQPESRDGWAAVAGTFVILLLGFGSAYSFGTFFAPLQSAFGGSRGAVALAFSVCAIILFAVGPASGMLADRVGPRMLVAGGTALVGAGLLAASRADALWQVQAAFGVGIGVGIGLSYVPAVAAVQKWFDRRRGLASGLAVSGIGAGTLLMPPLAALVIARTDWRTAFVIIGLAVIVIGGGAGMMVSDPARRNRATGSRPASGVRLRQAMRSRPFALVLVGFLCASFGQFIPMVHLIPFAEDRGMAPETAAILLSLLGLGSAIGRFAIGGAADRIGRWRALALTFTGLSLSSLWWLAATGFAALGGFAFLVGACYGGAVALAPAVMADYFGTRALSGIIGVLYTGVGVGAFAGPALAGVAFDFWQSYTVAIVFSAVAAGAGAALVSSAEAPARWRDRQRAENQERT